MLLFLTVCLMLAGFALLALEIFHPGVGVFGVTGVLLTSCAAVITILRIPFGLLFVLGELAVMLIAALAFFRYARRKHLYKRIVLSETLSEDFGREDYAVFLGKEGMVKTPLRTVGGVDFNGRTVEAHSEGIFIPEGHRVRAVAVIGGKLIVKPLDETAQNL